MGGWKVPEEHRDAIEQMWKSAQVEASMDWEKGVASILIGLKLELGELPEEILEVARGNVVVQDALKRTTADYMRNLLREMWQK